MKKWQPQNEKKRKNTKSLSNPEQMFSVELITIHDLYLEYW